LDLIDPSLNQIHNVSLDAARRRVFSWILQLNPAHA